MAYTCAVMNAGQRSQKQYGLIKPAKKAQPSVAKPSIFNNDSSSDGESMPAEKWSTTALKSISHGSVQAAQTRKVIRQAMQEDASLFQYDEVYDDMQQKKQTTDKTKKTEDKKPRYMQKLLESAEQRRHQQERRVERQVQLEREQEGDEFADKEQFVTEAYRQRLLERKKEEEQERRIKHIEEINDVTKQKDLGSFYRHMYQKSSGRTEPEVEQEPAEAAPAAAVKTKPERRPAARTGRQYRPRRVSRSPGSPERSPERSRSRDPERNGEARPDRRGQRPGDTDSDASEASSGESPAPSPAAPPPQQAPQQQQPPVRPRASSAEREARRRALYDKRTVGDVFEAARQRYLDRQAARLGGPCPVPAGV